MKTISAKELAQWLDPLSSDTRARPVLLDVREPWEVAICQLSDATLIPMREIPERFGTIDLDLPIVCICHHGARSAQVAAYLEHQGAREVWNLAGGVEAWALQVDPSLPRY